MTWFKLDDRFFDNPKIAALSAEAKVAYLEAGTYCARELTDGFVPLVKAKSIAGRPRVSRELIPGLWEPTEGGYMVHDYLKYNPTRDQVMRERGERNEAKVRAGKAGAAKRWGSSQIAPAIDSAIEKWQTDSKNHSPVKPVSPSSSRSTVDPAPQPPPSYLLQERPNIFLLYEQLLGRGVSPLIADRLKEYEQSHSQECIDHCFVEAAESNARTVKLLYSILDRHKNEGCLERKPMGRNTTSAQTPIDTATAIRLAYPGIKQWTEPDIGAGDGGLAPLDGDDDPAGLDVQG